MGDEIRIFLRENAEAVVGVMLAPFSLWCLWRAFLLVAGPWLDQRRKRRLTLPRTEDDRASP